MINLRKCPRCGAALPPEASVCPHDGARLTAVESFGYDGDEATVRRNLSDIARGSTAPAPGSRVAPADDADVEESSGEVKAWEQTVSRDVLVGRQLGDYVVKRRVGAGGMGIVYEGEHPIIGRKVAIKILRPDFAEGGRARDLVSEARAAAAIRHRGIIDIFGFGTIPDVGQYLVMEYLDGAPLDEVISRRSPMPEAEAIPLLDELLGALAAAHAVGVIHRDLKPGNVFVVKDSAGSEYVKVLDFGLAKRSEAPHGSTPQTRTSMMVGTPEYMAPEQACGQAVSPQTDLYAVGVIAFEMLSRRLPFEGASPMAIAIQHVQATPPRISDFVDVHPSLAALVMRLLEKEPSDRPASADAVRRELKSILRALGEPARTTETPSAPVPPTREAPRARTDRLPPGRPPRAPVRPSSPGPRSGSRASVPTQGRGEPRMPTPAAGTRTATPAAARAEPRRAPARTPQARPEPTVMLSESLEQDASSGRTAPDHAAMRTSIDATTLENGAIRPNRRAPALVAAGVVGVLALGVFALTRGGSTHPGSPDVVNVIPPKPLDVTKPSRLVANAPTATPPAPTAAVTTTPAPGPTPAPVVATLADKGPSTGTTLTASAKGTDSAVAIPTVFPTKRTEAGSRPVRSSRSSHVEAPAESPAKTGTLKLSMRGYGQIYVGDTYKGDQPGLIELPAGPNELTVRNRNNEVVFNEIIVVPANGTVAQHVNVKRASE